ncbi:hypothetical protein GAGA_3868 [Paraglaciecola agarilytica NO2]|uniref:Uncharacterized protein n=1 Tax=Paraglaciecola agarilytica NO2 TaxID=1125747 RepID=A0ABQ0IBN1_9ALTE|nr:hypothetical protein GAGA_3868 [Paraglaciecola agarilytica NO2]
MWVIGIYISGLVKHSAIAVATAQAPKQKSRYFERNSGDITPYRLTNST